MLNKKYSQVHRDVVIPNKLDNDKTCQGLRHWRLLSNLKNIFSKPVRNDMIKTITNLFSYSLFIEKFSNQIQKEKHKFVIISQFLTLKILYIYIGEN